MYTPARRSIGGEKVDYQNTVLVKEYAAEIRT